MYKCVLSTVPFIHFHTIYSQAHMLYSITKVVAVKCDFTLVAVITVNQIHHVSALLLYRIKLCKKKLKKRYWQTSNQKSIKTPTDWYLRMCTCSSIGSTVTIPTSVIGLVIMSLIDICLNSHLLAYFYTDWRWLLISRQLYQGSNGQTIRLTDRDRRIKRRSRDSEKMG